MAPKIEGAGAIRTAPPPAAAIPDHAIDASKIDVTSADFKALPASYQKAVKEAKAFAEKNFGGMAPAPKVLVTPSASNGNAPVTVIVPAGAKAPLSVDTHYHGDRASAVAGENAAADEIGKRVKAGDTTVFVLPEAKSTSGRTNWDNVGDINKTTAEALKSAGLGDQKVGHTTISAHSAGGRALANGVKDGKKLQADELVLQDALFEGNNGPGAYSALRKTLPNATAGVKTITIVPSKETTTSGERSATLAEDLKAKGRSVTIAPATKTHAAAAAVLDTSGPVPVSLHTDHFER